MCWKTTSEWTTSALCDSIPASERPSLGATLEALGAQDVDGDYEVIVVDDGSTAA